MSNTIDDMPPLAPLPSDWNGIRLERARILALLRAERQHAVELARFAGPLQRAQYRFTARVLKRIMREIGQ